MLGMTQEKERSNMAAMNVPGFTDRLWANGPSPGSFYNFPGNQNSYKTAEQISPAKRTM